MYNDKKEMKIEQRKDSKNMPDRQDTYMKRHTNTIGKFDQLARSLFNMQMLRGYWKLGSCSKTLQQYRVCINFLNSPSSLTLTS